MKQTRKVIAGSDIHKAVIYQVQKGNLHEYQGKHWKIIDAWSDAPGYITILLDDSF